MTAKICVYFVSELGYVLNVAIFKILDGLSIAIHIYKTEIQFFVCRFIENIPSNLQFAFSYIYERNNNNKRTKKRHDKERNNQMINICSWFSM